jgi:hypothetical protein
MKFRLIETRRALSALFVASALAGGMGLTNDTHAAPAAGMGGGMAQASGMQPKGQHRHGKHGGGHSKHGHKSCGLRGREDCGKHLLGDCWKRTLSVPQKARLDQIHANHAKIKAPLKARIEALKVDLAVMATAPQPGKAAIDAKIEELMRLKGQMLGAKYGYIAAQRQVLAPPQQVSFDMETIHRAMHGKEGRDCKGGRH